MRCPAARADRYWPSYRSGAPERSSVDFYRPSGANPVVLLTSSAP